VPNLIPSVVSVTAGGDGIISNDPLAAFDSMILPFDTGFNDITNNRYLLTAQGAVGKIPVITASNPHFGAGTLSLPSTSSGDNAWASVRITQGGPLDIISNNADFCVDFWVRIASGLGSTLIDYGNQQVLFADAGIYGFLISVSTSEVRVSGGIHNSVTGVAWVPLVGAGISANQWVHIAVARRSGTATLYINGVAQAGPASWLNYTFPPSTPSFLTLGWSEIVSGTLLPAQIDEFRVTKGNARYTANFTPPTGPTTFVPVSQGYSNGVATTDAFGSVSPNPALLDTDVVAAITVVNSGTPTTPVYAFEVIVEGLMLSGDLNSVSFIDANSVQQNFLGSNATFTLAADGSYGTWSWPTTGYLLPMNTATPVTMTFEDPNVEFNCSCVIASPYDTLVNVRKSVLISLGYPNQLTNPPPGMATLIDEALRDAQRQIYKQIQRAGLWTQRFFRWTMVPGQRYYGLSDNEGVCDAVLDPYKITWVGFEDLNKAWYRLDAGIPPEYYTRANINFGWPTRYEIRSCIEIFPAPQAAYTLWIKGDIGLAPLVADSDVFTVDDMACKLLALGNLKVARGDKDGQLRLQQAGAYIRGLISDAHATRRYVPRAETANPLTPPKFLPLGTDQA